jgi:hypothetical protein
LERQSREIERLLNELEAATSQNAMLSKEAERARALAAEAKKVTTKQLVKQKNMNKICKDNMNKICTEPLQYAYHRAATALV